jgi:hypothetical protein
LRSRARAGLVRAAIAALGTHPVDTTDPIVSRLQI